LKLATAAKIGLSIELSDLVPEFCPARAMTDFEQPSVATLREVFGNETVAGYWFFYALSRR